MNVLGSSPIWEVTLFVPEFFVHFSIKNSSYLERTGKYLVVVAKNTVRTSQYMYTTNYRCNDPHPK